MKQGFDWAEPLVCFRRHRELLKAYFMAGLDHVLMEKRGHVLSYAPGAILGANSVSRDARTGSVVSNGRYAILDEVLGFSVSSGRHIFF